MQFGLIPYFMGFGLFCWMVHLRRLETSPLSAFSFIFLRIVKHAMLLCEVMLSLTRISASAFHM